MVKAKGARWFVICRYVLALSSVLLAASSGVQAERLPITIFTTANGLAHNTVNRIVRDSRGILWFCTADGLSRFDGYTFTNFGRDACDTPPFSLQKTCEVPGHPLRL